MLQSVKPVCARILGLVLFCSTASAQQQATTTVETKSASFTIAEKALQWMPESFRRVMSRNMNNLKSGIDEVHAEKFLMPSDRLTLEDNLLQRMAATVHRLRARPKFSEVAKDFGAVTHGMLLLNLPESESGSTDKPLFLSEVIARNSQAFRIVVYDASELEGSHVEVKRLMETARERRNSLSRRFSDVEATRLSPAATTPLDPTSPLYGIAALVYSHAINDTARAWLWIWKSANGDMLGRPSVPAQP